MLAVRWSSAGADSVVAWRKWQGLEAMEVRLDFCHCSRLAGLNRLHQHSTHHRTERCGPARLHYQRHHSANGGTTEHNRHEQLATPQRVPRGGGKAPFSVGLGLRWVVGRWKKG
jgi:hypothetical protein